MFFWLVLIVRVATHQLKGDGSVDDIRSDDEEKSHRREVSSRRRKKTQ
jgi:hypothetical protein